MMWEGKIGPSFIIVVALAILNGVNWLNDGKSVLSERIAVVETQLKSFGNSLTRIEQFMEQRRRERTDLDGKAVPK